MQYNTDTESLDREKNKRYIKSEQTFALVGGKYGRDS